MSKCTFIFMLYFLVPSVTFADEPQSNYATEVLGACKAEVKDHCQNKNLKGSEITACLKEKSHDQKNKFTDSCRDTLAKKK